MLPSRVGEAELHGQRLFAVGHVSGIDDIALGMHPSECRIAVVSITESAYHVAFPQVEFLSFRLNAHRIGQRNVKANGA